MKLKCEEDEGDDHVNWEEASIAGNTNESFKVNYLTIDAEAFAEDVKIRN